MESDQGHGLFTYVTTGFGHHSLCHLYATKGCPHGCFRCPGVSACVQMQSPEAQNKRPANVVLAGLLGSFIGSGGRI